MTMTPRLRSALTAFALASAALASATTATVAPVLAATETVGMSEALKGFGSNAKDPIQIDADSLEVLDKDQTAVFTGNVHVLQKDTVLRTLRLKVFYEGKAATALSSTAAPKPAAEGGDQQQIRRLEAEGKVLINQKDQTVVGDSGWFDMRSHTAQITGHVVLTQGKNVGRGEWLKVDLRTGQYTLGGGRVQLILESQKPAGQ